MSGGSLGLEQRGTRGLKLSLGAFFDSATVQRGTVYAQSGRVLYVTERDGTLEAMVLGSGGARYQISLDLALMVTGALVGIDGTCTCPVGDRCKHMVAVLLALQDKPGLVAKLGLTTFGQTALAFNSPGPDRAERPAETAPLPVPLASWLGELKAAQPATPDAAPDYPPSVRDRLIYVLSAEGGKVNITVLKAALLKDGSLARQASRYEVHRIKRQTPPRFITRRDLELLRDLEAAGLPANGPGPYGYNTPNYLPAGPPDLSPLLVRLAATGRAHWLSHDGPALHQAPPRAARFDWVTRTGGDQELGLLDAATGAELRALAGATPVWVDPATGAFGLIETDLAAGQFQVLARAPKVVAERAREMGLALADLSLPVPVAKGVESRVGRNPVPLVQLLGLAGERLVRESHWSIRKEKLVLPAVRLSFDYGGGVAPARGNAPLRFEEGATVISLSRDAGAEAAAHVLLRQAGAVAVDDLTDYQFPKDGVPGDLVLLDDGAGPSPGQALRFADQSVARLRAAGWRVDVAKSWPYRLTDQPGMIRAHAGATGTGLFDFGLTLSVGDQRADLAPVIAGLLARLPATLSAADLDGEAFQALLQDMPAYVALPDGSHARIDPDQLAALLLVFLRNLGLVTRLHPAEAGQLFELAEALQGCGVPFDGGEALLALGARLSALCHPESITPPPSLQAELRPYQALGYGWLSALSATGFGGLLADDMGLGKTVQTLALLAEVHLERKAPNPSLLIVPTSLARAWARQAAQFVPGLRVLVLQGHGRQALFPQIANADLVISTYPLLHRDHEVLLTRDWELAILDEAQAVKNPAATAAKRIREIRARMRLALTGTPMENTLTDLWTLFDWLIPGLLGDRKSFRATVTLPIERDGNPIVQAWLNRRIRPFLLRRTKDEVALDLPEKTEIIDYVPLGDKQQALYETVRMAMDRRVRDAIAARGVKGATITILDALLKMRQACCDPALLKDGAVERSSQSAKRDRLIEMLEALVAEGRRILVFSQFVEMLRLIEVDVKAHGWSYEWLTGETRDRDAVITRFQQGGAAIFLISLKAGGVGLTLTAADTVVLYDPWWNPAVERQAMDRAHRIGQSKAVFVYRLVAEGTVEEAMLTLQAKKQALADALFDGGATTGQSFDAETIADLFRPLPLAG